MPNAAGRPDPLEFLREQERAHGTYHVEFRLAYGPRSDWTPALFDEGLDRWFGGKAWRAENHSIILLGTDWSGGMFCTWSYPELGLRPPPVVYLGSEGQALSVVAIDTHAFVELLATGRIWGRSARGTFDDDDQPPAHLLFAQSARDRFGFAGRPAETIQKEGAAAHPDFNRWVEAHVS